MLRFAQMLAYRGIPTTAQRVHLERHGRNYIDDHLDYVKAWPEDLPRIPYEIHHFSELERNGGSGADDDNRVESAPFIGLRSLQCPGARKQTCSACILLSEPLGSESGCWICSDNHPGIFVARLGVIRCGCQHFRELGGMVDQATGDARLRTAKSCCACYTVPRCSHVGASARWCSVCILMDCTGFHCVRSSAL